MSLFFHCSATNTAVSYSFFFIGNFEIWDKRPGLKWSKQASLYACVCVCWSIVVMHFGSSCLFYSSWIVNSAHNFRLPIVLPDCVFPNRNWWAYFLFQWIETNQSINPIWFGMEIFSYVMQMGRKYMHQVKKLSLVETK